MVTREIRRIINATSSIFSVDLEIESKGVKINTNVAVIVEIRWILDSNDLLFLFNL